MNTTAPSLASTFLFRFAVPCYRIARTPKLELPEHYRIASFGELDGQAPFADLRVGWNTKGLVVSLSVRGKKQPPWCRRSRMNDSDGVFLFIDTRNTQTIHRASRFCHQIALLPKGHGPQYDAPVGELMEIARARQNPDAVDLDTIRVKSEKRIDGYLLQALIPAAALTGFDPQEQPSLGFHYIVLDRELGTQTFAVPTQFPADSDPSLWGTLELVDATAASS